MRHLLAKLLRESGESREVLVRECFDLRESPRRELEEPGLAESTAEIAEGSQRLKEATEGRRCEESVDFVPEPRADRKGLDEFPARRFTSEREIQVEIGIVEERDEVVERRSQSGPLEIDDGQAARSDHEVAGLEVAVDEDRFRSLRGPFCDSTNSRWK